jgi:hypothetical protein
MDFAFQVRLCGRIVAEIEGSVELLSMVFITQYLITWTPARCRRSPFTAGVGTPISACPDPVSRAGTSLRDLTSVSHVAPMLASAVTGGALPRTFHFVIGFFWGSAFQHLLHTPFPLIPPAALFEKLSISIGSLVVVSSPFRHSQPDVRYSNCS